jgi:hypothetical protein
MIREVGYSECNAIIRVGKDWKHDTRHLDDETGPH